MERVKFRYKNKTFSLEILTNKSCIEFIQLNTCVGEENQQISQLKVNKQ